MTLSADKLNLCSPYQLTQINDLTFNFETDTHENPPSLFIMLKSAGRFIFIR